MQISLTILPSLLEVLIVSMMGGMLFQWLHIPLAWMLGPLASTMLWKVWSGRRLYWPVSFRNGGLMILGFLLGTSFTVETMQQIFFHLPSMLFVTMMTILFSFAMAIVVSRGSQIDMISSIVGSVPGGLSQMIVLGEELKGVDPTIVTFMQTFRVMAVIFIVPFLVGQGIAGEANPAVVEPVVGPPLEEMRWSAYLLFAVVVFLGAKLGEKIYLPTAPLLGPLLGTAGLLLAGFEAPSLPPFIIILSQLMVGAHMGLIMNPTSLSNWKKFAPYVTGANVALILFSLGLGWLLTFWHPISLLSAFLGTSPGGIAEMGITAREVHADLSMVAAYHMFRVFFILFFAPPFLRWWIRRTQHSRESGYTSAKDKTP